MRTLHPTRTVAVLAIAVAWACGSDSSTGPARPGPGTLSVIPSSATIAAGQAIHLTAKLVDEFGDPLETPVTWSSSNESVATVSVAGNVFGRAEGRAAIVASSHGKIQSSSIRVTAREPKPKPK